jgi:methylated-DNA-protein-cysteine methyltransferase-like protein
MQDELARPVVFSLIKQIPQGFVSTYKVVAQAGGINARQVGRILHTNTNPEIYPCHRVVHSDGSTASGFAFGGPGKQQELLERENVLFKGNRVVLPQFLFKNFLKK